jgi:uracil-DNA glycosylase
MEPKLGRPFAWTAGQTLVKRFHETFGWTEDEVRDRIYFAAVCRCIPGKKAITQFFPPAPWHRLDSGKTLLRPALKLVAAHPAVRR